LYTDLQAPTRRETSQTTTASAAQSALDPSKMNYLHLFWGTAANTHGKRLTIGKVFITAKINE
jgi:hypothetical protein